MKSFTSLSIAIFATQALHVAASGSVCSSGIYAALAPLDNYPPAVSYCQGQANKATVTVSTTITSTVSAAQKRGVKTTSAKSSSSTSTKTTLKTTTSTANAKAAQWSSLVAQAEAVVATFCSCAGYPATTTTTITSTVTAIPPGAVQCSDGSYAIPCQCDAGQIGQTECSEICETFALSGTGCINYGVSNSGDCTIVFDRCPGNAGLTCGMV